jgi:hypothetical protein
MEPMTEARLAEIEAMKEDCGHFDDDDDGEGGSTFAYCPCADDLHAIRRELVAEIRRLQTAAMAREFAERTASRLAVV